VSYPERFSVGVHAYSDGETDANGNPVPVYDPPLDETGTPALVYGWAVTSTGEPEAGEPRVVTTLDLYAPPGFSVGAQDIIDLDRVGQCLVIGEVKDWSTGPFGWNPGVSVTLRKVAG
jgi:hypothetical protein